MFFLKNLKYLQNEMSLMEFSRFTKIPYRTLQDIYSKQAENPKADTLLKLKEAFNISIDDLLTKDLARENGEINNV